MKKVKVARGIEITPMSLGTAEIGAGYSEQTGYEMLDRFIELGGRLIDTARVYSDWVPGEIGRSERIIGEWIAARRSEHAEAGIRPIVATKGAHPPIGDFDTPRLSESEIRGDAELSIAALGVEPIDLYYLHLDDPARPVSQIVDTLDRLVSDGLITRAACSNWSVARIQAALEYAEEYGKTRFVANQVMWNMATAGMPPRANTHLLAMSDEMLALHQSRGMPVFAYSSQASGYFAKLAADPSSERARSMRYHTPTNQRRAEAAARIAKDRDCSANQVALAFLLHQPASVVPVIGPRTVAQLEDSMASLNVSLSEAEMDELRR